MADSELDRPVTRLEVDGVPVFHVEAPAPHVVAVVFRVGAADEPLRLRGVTHLAEHLALWPLGRRPYEYNGYVALTATGFHASGSADEVAGFLGEVCTSASALDMSRLAHERRILATEAASVGGSLVDVMLETRYGAAGPGAVSYREVALQGLFEEALAAWCARYLTAGNAVAWAVGPTLPELSLPLPPGERMPLPAATPTPGLVTPAWRSAGEGVVAAGLVAEPSAALWMALQVATERTTDALRRGHGVSYACGWSYERHAAGEVHAMVTADTLPEHVDTVQRCLVAVLDDLAGDGPAERELADVAARAERSWRDGVVHAPGGYVARYANEELMGREPRTVAAVADEIRALAPEAVRDALGAALGSMILLLPGEATPVDERFQPPSPPPSTIDGPFHPARDARGGAQHGIVMTGVGIASRGDVQPAPEVRFDVCEAALVDSAGFVTLVGSDASWVSFRPTAVADGDRVLRNLLARVPERRLLPLDERASRWLAVLSVALRDLRAGWRSWRELERLAGLLDPGEGVRVLAEAGRPLRTELVAVTDRRLLGVRGGDDGDPLRSYELGDVAEVSSSSRPRLVGGGAVAIRTREGAARFSDIVPPERVADLVAALGGADRDGG